jgi:hypothetical protein
MSAFIDPPSFSKETPNKVGNEIEVSGENTLIKTRCCVATFLRCGSAASSVAIADKPIDATINGKKIFCVRVDNAGVHPDIMIGFTPLKKFDSKTKAFFGYNGFKGCGLNLLTGKLFFPGTTNGFPYRNVIKQKISDKAKEIIVILTTSNNGTKKEIRFLCDGKESKSAAASNHLRGEKIYPAFCLHHQNQQVTTIPIQEITKRTPAVEVLLREAALVHVERAKRGTKEKKVKQAAMKKTKKETKQKTTKATKKKEEMKNIKKEKKTEAKK